jgi:hypothetical protein
MYYLPERIFLCKFKYFSQSQSLVRGGVGGEELSDSVCFMGSQTRIVLLMTTTRKKIII